MRPSLSFRSPLRLMLVLCLLYWLSACSTLDRGTPPSLERQASWVVLPFANHTETPLAGHRAEAIAQALLHTQGVGTVRRVPTNTQQEALFNAGDSNRMDEALAWAREQGVRYALAGAVEEWRYKVGVDGEPAVGVALSVVDVSSGRTVWSGVGARSGWSRDALSAVAQKLLKSLLEPAVRP